MHGLHPYRATTAATFGTSTFGAASGAPRGDALSAMLAGLVTGRPADAAPTIEAPEPQVGDDMHKDILAALPHLRAFAHLLARDHAMAEDLVQDTVVRALTYRHQFQPGTNLRGWLTIILRNRYFNEIRRRSRKAELHIEMEWGAGSTSGGQEENLEVRDFKRAFQSLPAAQREALLLVGASGVSYEEAAKITACAVGTIKSRVSRARAQLQHLLDGTPEKTFDGYRPVASRVEISAAE